jgi:hypothetical protein
VETVELTSPDELAAGDYLHRAGRPALKVMSKRRLGAVYRVAGLTRRLGHEVAYPEADRPVTVTRGFRYNTLPEHDEGAPE